MQHKSISLCLRFIIFALFLFSFYLVAESQTTSLTECLKPHPLSQTEKQEYIKDVRKIIGSEDNALINFNDKRAAWIKYFRCIEESRMGVSIERSSLSFQEKAKLFDDFAQKSLSETLNSINVNEDNAEAKTVAAQIAFLFGEKAESIKLVDDAIILDSKNFEAHFVAGIIKNDLASIERSIALNANFAPAYQYKVERLINEANSLKGNEQLLKQKAALETLKAMLSLPLTSSTEFWQEQEVSLDAWLKTREIQLVNKDEQALPLTSQNMGTSTKLSILSKPRAKYTELARLMQTTGATRLRVTLNADGQIKDVLVVNFLPHGLTQEAVKAVKQITFAPETHNGVLVSASKLIEYHFNLF